MEFHIKSLGDTISNMALGIGNLHNYVREIVMIRHVGREKRRKNDICIGNLSTWPMRYPTRDENVCLLFGWLHTNGSHGMTSFY